MCLSPISAFVILLVIISFDSAFEFALSAGASRAFNLTEINFILLEFFDVLSCGLLDEIQINIAEQTEKISIGLRRGSRKNIQ